MVAAGASALSLGASRGAVVLGNSLDLTFDVQPDVGSDVATSCVTAAVKSGDVQLSESKVFVTPLPETGGRSGVRVQASTAIDEPIVQVTLTAGCSGRVTRTYTFLADPPQAAPRSIAGLGIGSVAPGINRGRAAGLAQQDNAAVERSPQAAEQVVPKEQVAASRPPFRPAAPTAGKEPRPAATVSPSKRAPVSPAVKEPSRSRLVMEPLDTWLELPLTLRATPELLQAPAPESTLQRQEAAALWRTLNLDPQALAQEQAAQRQLQAEVTQLRTRATRDQAATAELQRQVQELQDQRLSSWLVYALGTALVLVLALCAWLWRRTDRAVTKTTRSWREAVAVSSRKASGQDVVDVDQVEQVEQVTAPPADRWGRPLADRAPAQPPAPVPAPPAAAVDILLEPREVSLEEAGFEPPAARAAQAEPALHHIVNPEELFDIQQQAEFFVSVGEHDQAVDVLRQHIAEHEETSPVAYLELLRLYRTLSRAGDFNALRQQFMRHFNAHVPEFSAFDRMGKPLDQYLDALSEIEAEWSSPNVLHVLEKHMFYRAGEARKAPFDLAAYDDLLLLLAIAQTTPSSARGAPPPRKRTTPQPQSFEAAAAHALSSLGQLDISPDFPLDSLAAALEFGFEPPAPPAATAQVQASEASLQSAPGANIAATTSTAHAPASGEGEGYTRESPFTLDIDLSEPVPITISDLPPVPVTPPPPPGQPIGFGSSNDLMELSLELEPVSKPEQKKP